MISRVRDLAFPNQDSPQRGLECTCKDKAGRLCCAKNELAVLQESAEEGREPGVPMVLAAPHHCALHVLMNIDWPCSAASTSAGASVNAQAFSNTLDTFHTQLLAGGQKIWYIPRTHRVYCRNSLDLSQC